MSRRLLDDSVKQQPGLPQAGPLESLRESWPNSVPRYPSVMDASDLSKSRGKGLHLWIQVHLDCILQVSSCLPVRWHALNETLWRQSKEAQLDSSCLYRRGDTTSSTLWEKAWLRRMKDFCNSVPTPKVSFGHPKSTRGKWGRSELSLTMVYAGTSPSQRPDPTSTKQHTNGMTMVSLVLVCLQKNSAECPSQPEDHTK